MSDDSNRSASTAPCGLGTRLMEPSRQRRQSVRRGLLASLILVAAVANLNLAVANVALPEIGQHFDSSQTVLDLIAVAYSLGLACSVLWFGALGTATGES